MELEIYRKIDRCLPLIGKIPARPGNWRINTISYAEAKRRLSQGGNFGFVIPENMIVIDVDPRNGGLESYDKLLDDLSLPDLVNQYPSVITGGGGLHIYASIGVDYAKVAGHSSEYPGIDIKKFGGYVVGAGSVHPETKRKYDIFNDPSHAPRIYPQILKVFLHRVKSAAPVQKAEITPGQLAVMLEKIPVTDYQNHAEWFGLMCAAHTATAGAGAEEFIAWSISDPKYSDHESQIRHRWETLRLDVTNPRTVATLYDAIPKEQRASVSISMQLESAPEAPGLESLRAAAGGYDVESDLPYQIARRLLSERRLKSCGDERFWEYTRTHWRPIHTNLVKRYIFETYAAMGQEKAASGILSPTLQMLESLTAVSDTPAGLPNVPGYSIINCLNGEVWLDDVTGAAELREHRPESNQITCLPLRYDPRASAPRFTQFLNEIFDSRSDVISHLMEVLGYTIQAKKNIASWVLFYGRGANGKTVLLSILSAILGETALEKPIATISTDRNNHAMADLPGKLAIIDDDVSSHTILPDGELKSLSENKWLNANPKNASPFRFRSCVIPILSANMFPSTKDISDGLKRRALVFLFERQFAPNQQDVHLTDKIVTEELSGVLNIFLAGLRRLRRRGHFAPPRCCLAARDLWYSANNPTIDFIGDRLIKSSPEVVCPFDLVWASYCDYVIAEGIRKPMSRNRLREHLSAAGVTVLGGRPVRIAGYRVKNIGGRRP